MILLTLLGYLRYAIAWLRVETYRPRGWVADLVERRPSTAAVDIVDTVGEDAPDDLTALEADALACASYIVEIGAAHWTNIAEPLYRARGNRRRGARS